MPQDMESFFRQRPDEEPRAPRHEDRERHFNERHSYNHYREAERRRLEGYHDKHDDLRPESDEHRYTSEHDQRYESDYRPRDYDHYRPSRDDYDDYYSRRSSHPSRYESKERAYYGRGRSYDDDVARRQPRSNDDNDETYYRGQKKQYNPSREYQPYMQYGRVPRPLYRETDEEKEAREHFEFGQRWGATSPYYAPKSHRQDPFDAHYDPYIPLEHMRSEKRPHWTDDDEGFSLDFSRQPRDIYVPRKYDEMVRQPVRYSTKKADQTRQSKDRKETKPSSGQVSDPTATSQKPTGKSKSKKDKSLQEKPRQEKSRQDQQPKQSKKQRKEPQRRDNIIDDYEDYDEYYHQPYHFEVERHHDSDYYDDDYHRPLHHDQSHEFFYEQRKYPSNHVNRYWQLLDQAERDKSQEKSDRDSKTSQRQEPRKETREALEASKDHDDAKDKPEHSHYLHGSRDVAHHQAHFVVEDTDYHDREDEGRYMHGSEDVKHHHRWYHLLQALEQEEAHRKQDDRQEKEQEDETSYWQDIRAGVREQRQEEHELDHGRFLNN